jgi:hypothetical protein
MSYINKVLQGLNEAKSSKYKISSAKEFAGVVISKLRTYYPNRKFEYKFTKSKYMDSVIFINYFSMLDTDALLLQSIRDARVGIGFQVTGFNPTGGIKRDQDTEYSVYFRNMPNELPSGVPKFERITTNDMDVAADSIINYMIRHQKKLYPIVDVLDTLKKDLGKIKY